MDVMKRILHVDNSGFFRKMMKSFLLNEGFEVESYDNARDASMGISGGLIDMVIMGLAFTDIDGEEFLKSVSESFSGPIIVVTGSVDAEKENRLAALGCRAAIGKTGWQSSLKPYLSELRLM